MSRKGNKILTIPSGVTVKVENNKVMVNGPKGQLEVPFPSVISVAINGNEIKVSRANDEKQSKMFHGTINALIQIGRAHV